MSMLTRRLDRSLMMPMGWGVVRRDWLRDEVVIAIIPLNLVLRWLHEFYWWLSLGGPRTARERAMREVHAARDHHLRDALLLSHRMLANAEAEIRRQQHLLRRLQSWASTPAELQPAEPPGCPTPGACSFVATVKASESRPCRRRGSRPFEHVGQESCERLAERVRGLDEEKDAES